MKYVLFVCTHNAGLRDLIDDRLDPIRVDVAPIRAAVRCQS